MNRIWDQKRGVILVGLFVLLVLSIQNASATGADVAYILKDSSSVNPTLTNILDQNGLSYDIVRDGQISTTDFSGYSFLLIVEDLARKNQIPYSEHNVLFLEKKIGDIVWTVGGTGVTNSRRIEAYDESSFVFDGISIPLDNDIDVYTGTNGGQVQYLTPTIPTYLQVVSVRTGIYRPNIAYRVTQSGDQTIKHMFFGLPDIQLWTDNTKLMFDNSVNWIITDVDEDGDGWSYGEDCNDSDSNIYPGAPESPYDGLDQDCDGYDLIDLDGDGYCALGLTITSSANQCELETSLVGTDCDDFDDYVNIDNSDPLYNCVNDGPSIYSDDELIFAENDEVVIVVNGEDPDEDDLTYSINDARFIQNENEFSWQTGYEDAGTYDFTVSVSDGEFSSSKNVRIILTNTYRDIEFENIPDVTWDEDSSVSIDLNNYATNFDGNTLTFGVDDYQGDEGINFVIEENTGIVTFNSIEDWNGYALIRFYINDGFGTALSNYAQLEVLPVNDPVAFDGNIENLSFPEDSELIDAIDLSNYFSDVDSELSYDVFGNSEIDVIIENGIVSFLPAPDFAGSEEIYFVASDEDYQVQSNTLSVNVLDVGEPPVFEDFFCESTIDEDLVYTCELNASDYEGEELTYSVTSENNLNCGIDGNVLTYSSFENYNGLANCELAVNDPTGGSDSYNLEVEIYPVNDQPVIVSSDPQLDATSVIQGKTKLFKVVAEDIDSEYETIWYLDGEVVDSFVDQYLFSEDVGEYNLKVEVRDEEYSVYKEWQVIVGPTSDYTCSEVGGYEISEKEICTSDFLDVKDSDLCCSLPGTPNFEDANSCEEFDDRMSLEILKPLTTDKINLGDGVGVEFRVFNRLDEDQDVDVELHLYDLDSDRSVDSMDSYGTINSDRSRTFKLNFEVPEDLDLEDNYAFFVKAEDNICAQDYLKLDNLRRLNDKLYISRFDMPSEVSCGDAVNAKVTVDNIGSNDQNGVIIYLKNRELKIDESSPRISIEQYGESDRESKEFTFLIPDNVLTGDYTIESSVSYSGVTEKLTKKIRVNCLSEDIQTEVVENIDEPIVLNDVNTQPVSGEDQKPKSKMSMPLLIGVITLDFIVFAGVLVLYLVFRNKEV